MAKAFYVNLSIISSCEQNWEGKIIFEKQTYDASLVETLEAVYVNNFKVATISDWICPTMLKHLIVFRKHARIISFSLWYCDA